MRTPGRIGKDGVVVPGTITAATIAEWRVEPAVAAEPEPPVNGRVSLVPAKLAALVTLNAKR